MDWRPLPHRASNYTAGIVLGADYAVFTAILIPAS